MVPQQEAPNSRQRVNWWWLVVVAAAGLIVLLVSVPALKNAVFGPPPPANAATGSPTTTAPSNSVCTPWQVHYFANDPGKANPFDFGPALQGSTAKQFAASLQQRYECDPALVEATLHAYSLAGQGTVNGAALTAATTALGANVTQWKSDVQLLDSYQNAASVTLTSESGPYWTLGMVTGTPPVIEQYNPNRTAPVLEFSFTNGVKWDIETDCGGQPRFETPFIGVPVYTPPSTPQATTPSPTTPPATVTPSCSSNCGSTTVPTTLTCTNGSLPASQCSPATTVTTPPTTAPPTTVACPPGSEGVHGKCIPPTTVAPPPVTAAPSSPTTVQPVNGGQGDSGPGAYNTVPPAAVPTTVAQPVAPPVTSPPTTAAGDQGGSNCGNAGQPACGGGVGEH